MARTKKYVPFFLWGGGYAAPVPETQSDKNRDKKLTKVSVVTRQSKLSELLKAYSAIGVTDVTITNVLGCGTQKGQTEYYRGAPIEMQLRPKVKVEAVISKVPADLVRKTAASCCGRRQRSCSWRTGRRSSRIFLLPAP